MRVIAGVARSMPLKTLKGDETRPTTDRIKETIFNILAPDITGARFLDLFAGCGGIGIEALSRGASKAVFVEKSEKACAVIDQNLKFTKLRENGEVLRKDAFDGISELNGSKPFDIIYMDPPYGRKIWLGILELLERSTLVDQYTLIVVEEDLSDDIKEGESYYGFEIKRIKKYRSDRHIFLKKGGSNND